ncbi:MAG: 2-oxoglutarate dehydrogenase complex dihydrolipoyllysine-residue succinyltransferase [Gammaproteobacteria bacterium]|nr:2-oxoglutarate dehydrogenase complex dihydrolipoyllysine-residue succinyltransferase [Gammaproteobacteria bacterium]MBP9728762.1 2-oxoglutarate dehydrogenase complex dihydrolipoyllysine-residue succinyltransferase [Gammaproteobacteria bacterium]
MSIQIKTPVLPESISEAKIITWYKKVGEVIHRSEHLVDFETDKIVLEVVAPCDGTLVEIIKESGALVKSEEIIGSFEAATLNNTVEQPKVLSPSEPVAETSIQQQVATLQKPVLSLLDPSSSPAVRRLASEKNVNWHDLQGTGKKGRLTKDDVLKASTPTVNTEQDVAPALIQHASRSEKRVAMSRLRTRIAERLVEVQKTAAILTTFNEINMQPIIDLRTKYQAVFQKDHGVRLGFMSFFTQAVVEALKRSPILNASVEGQDIIYHDYYDISVAVASERGLVVPVMRDADKLHMADIEKKMVEFSDKAKNNQLTLEEIQGGTFTLSNGGVFGSLMSTPILNPPQSAILGMHKIMPRPIVEEGIIVIRPMMYVALSYDHRIIDGMDAAKFLVTVKSLLEEPARLWLEI